MPETDLLVVDDGEYATDELDANQRRTARSVTEQMLVVPEYTGAGYATALYHVYSASQSAYTVELVDGACDCPDLIHQNPAGGCKHLRRVRLLCAGEPSMFPAPDEPVAGYADELRDLLTTLDDRCAVLQNAIEQLRGTDDTDHEPTPRLQDRVDEYRALDWFRSELREEPILNDC